MLEITELSRPSDPALPGELVQQERVARTARALTGDVSARVRRAA